jgi:hypothetical protein
LNNLIRRRKGEPRWAEEWKSLWLYVVGSNQFLFINLLLFIFTFLLLITLAFLLVAMLISLGSAFSCDRAEARVLILSPHIRHAFI